MSSKKKTDPKPSVLARIIVGVTLFALLGGVFVGLGVGAHYAFWSAQPTLSEGEQVTVVIPHDTSWSGVVEILDRAGVVSRPRYFDAWGRREGLPARTRAGSYTFEGPMDLDELAAALAKGGAVEELSVTVPEGFTIFHIADRLAKSGLASREDFLHAARDPAALAEAGIEAESFEGYLFPDTYRFKQGTAASEIVARLHQRWRDVWNELEFEHPKGLAARTAQGMSLHELVTLASIVERESAVADERQLIARVFYNRFEEKMKLQSDPTCVYAESTYDQVPSPKTCRDPLNRYSTYVVEGLPPGPIANPGRGSLAAVLEPAEGEEAGKLLYFVAKRDGKGSHHFSATLKEHNAAVRKYLR